MKIKLKRINPHRLPIRRVAASRGWVRLISGEDLNEEFLPLGDLEYKGGRLGVDGVDGIPLRPIVV
jgi:hypothetical protein